MKLTYSVENGSDKMAFHIEGTKSDATSNSTERPRDVWETVFVQYDILLTQIFWTFPSTMNSSKQEEGGSNLSTPEVKAIVGLNRQD